MVLETPTGSKWSKPTVLETSGEVSRLRRFEGGPCQGLRALCARHERAVAPGRGGPKRNKVAGPLPEVPKTVGFDRLTPFGVSGICDPGFQQVETL